MTIAQSGGPHAGSTARIRILGDPSPVPARVSRVPLIGACVVVAVVGVGAALALQTVTAPSSDAPTVDRRVQVAADSARAEVGVGTGVAGLSQGTATTRQTIDGVTTARPTARLQRLMVTAAEATLPSAARYAERTTPRTSPTRKSDPPAAAPAQPVVSQIPAARETVAPAAPPVPASNDAVKAAPKTVGPEQPPNPANPNSQIGSP